MSSEHTALEPASFSTDEVEEGKREGFVRVAFLLEYCGAPFKGSQFQPDTLTVQGTVQSALQRLNIPASAVSFAGRTDAGVHARGQVAHVDVSARALDNIPDFAKALNAFLPESLSIKAFHGQATRRFNSRRDATCKWYRYRIYTAVNRSVWASQAAAAHYSHMLDAEKMNGAAQLLLGSHNFRSFKGADTDVVDDICRILHINVFRQDDFINFDIVADRFLYKMVRNIAGQLIAIGNTQYLQSPESILAVLAAQDRRCAAATAKAEGLTLMSVLYPPHFNFFAHDSNVRQLEAMLNPMKMEPLHEDLFCKAS